MCATGFVLEIEGKVAAGSRLVLGRQWKLAEEEPLPQQAASVSNLQQSTDLQGEDSEDVSGMWVSWRTACNIEADDTDDDTSDN